MPNNKEFELTKGSGGVAFVLAVLLPSISVGLIFAIIRLAAANDSSTGLTDTSLFTSIALTQLTLALIVILVCKGGRNTLRVCRLSVPKSPRHALLTLTVFVGAFFGLAITAHLFMIFLSQFGYTPPTSPFPSIDSIPKYLLAILLIAISPAIFEELIFRGIILNSLMPYGKFVAIIGSGFLFMMLHASPVQTVYQFIMGIILAIYAIKTGNLFYPILIHFLNNFTAISFEYFQIANDETLMPIYIILGSIIFLIIGLTLIIREKDVIKRPKKVQLDKLLLSDNMRMNGMLIAQERNKVNSDTAVMVISYVIGIFVCCVLWGINFSQGFK